MLEITAIFASVMGFWYTFEVPVFQGGDFGDIAGNTDSLLSPQGFFAKFRNFVVVTPIYLRSDIRGFWFSLVRPQLLKNIKPVKKLVCTGFYMPIYTSVHQVYAILL